MRKGVDSGSIQLCSVLCVDRNALVLLIYNQLVSCRFAKLGICYLKYYIYISDLCRCMDIISQEKIAHIVLNV